MNFLIEPLETGVEVLLSKPGDHQIQMEVPKSSTLTFGEKQRILDIASWQNGRIVDKADGGEGIRDAKIRREMPIVRSGLVFNALQLSGIGYRPFRFVGKSIIIDPPENMCPPSLRNFRQQLPPDAFFTVVFKNGEAGGERTEYEPLGAYTHEGLVDKIERTRLVGNLDLLPIVTPAVEAWGRYVNKQHNGKPIGFLVFTGLGMSRFDNACQKAGAEYVRQGLFSLGKGLRKLHDAGYAHRQPHLANFYFDPRPNKVLLMDWATLVQMPKERKGELAYRLSDVLLPFEGALDIAKKLPAQHKDPRAIINLAGTVINGYNGRQDDIASILLADPLNARELIETCLSI